MRFVVFSSSRGTAFQATIHAIARGELHAECRGLVTDGADRGCAEKAATAGVPVQVVERRGGEAREDFDRRVHAATLRLLAAREAGDIIALMGWMWILSPWFIGEWKRRIVNTHPALLPKFGGEGMYGAHVHRAVLAAKEAESGMTIHVVDSGVDTGPILLQKRCRVEKNDTAETLQARVQELEKEWYPKALEMIHQGDIRLPTRE